MTRPIGPITVFTPSDAAESNSNAQNLTVKEIVSRLAAGLFHVTMSCEGAPDPRIAARRNTRLLPWTRHGNTFRSLRHCLFPPPDIYFFPRSGPLDRIFFDARKRLGLRTAVVSYVVMEMNPATATGLVARSVVEGTRIVGNSRHVCRTIHERFGVEADAIYDGVDRRHYFAPAARSDRAQPIVLYAGSFQTRKRVELVIREAARLPDVHFRLAGQGPTENSCRQLVGQLGCANVSFLGHLSAEKLGQEMRNADVFFFPSILEGNPQVLLQAAACGLPCIAMGLYHSDYVLQGESGFLARTDAELSAALSRLMAEADLRRKFSHAAIRHTQQFDWDRIAQQWASVFQQVVAERAMHWQRRAS
jgi:glycosyltransferase involved in cell wall biosynthesis